MEGTYQFDVQEVSGVVVIEVRGSLVGGPATPSASSGEEAISLNDAIDKQLDQGRRLYLINLKQVEHVNSTGMGLLILAYAAVKKAGGRLKICGAREQIAGGPFRMPGVGYVSPMGEDCERALIDLMKRGT